jgi:hypothetical protein
MTAGPKPASHCRDLFAPGSHRCRGRGRYRDRDRFRRCIVVGPHARCSLVARVSSASSTMRSSKALRVAFPASGCSYPNPVFFCPSIPIPIPTPTPIIISTAIGMRHFSRIMARSVFYSFFDQGGPHVTPAPNTKIIIQNYSVARIMDGCGDLVCFKQNGGLAIVKSRRMIHA